MICTASPTSAPYRTGSSARKSARVKDIADLDIQGGYVKQYVVEPDPKELAARGLTFKDLIDGLQKDQVSTGAGYVEHYGDAYRSASSAGRRRSSRSARSIIAQQNGTPVRVADVADVVSGREQRFGAATLNGREVVWGIAAMLTGANSRTAAAGVDAEDGRAPQASSARRRDHHRRQPHQAGRLDHPHRPPKT